MGGLRNELSGKLNYQKNGYCTIFAIGCILVLMYFVTILLTYL